MPQIESQHLDQSNDPQDPEVGSSSETLFLLSICRDEDDAAALRSDLKRSGLGAYKIQRCVSLDDAVHLMQVCGFDLAFIRLDDFQAPQAAVEIMRQNDPDLAIVSMTSSRLLNSEGFEMPSGIDGNCRIEDLSPTLVSNLVSNILGQKRDRQEKQRLNQQLNFAVEVGDLGAWTLDIETARVSLDNKGTKALGIASAEQIPFLDDLLEVAYPGDQDGLKRLFDLSIETQGDLEASFRLNNGSKAGPSIQISAIYRPGGPRSNPTLSGFLKRESHSADEIQSRIEAANEAIQKALTLRDDAIATASKEMELLMQKVGDFDSSNKESPPIIAPKSATPEVAPTPRPLPEKAKPAETTPPIEKTQIASEPPPPPESHPKVEAPAAPAPSPQADAEKDQSLGIDKSHALQQVLKSITRQKQGPSDDTFPFDFSTEKHSDYSEPSPQNDGFIGAAKRLIDITQNGNELAVTLSVDNDGAIEIERERDLLFEILKELLTNVVKHAKASECIIALFRDEDDWVMQVEDDGVGLENNLVSISTPLNKIGLFRIRTKLALKGGQLDLTPTFPKGLIARARLPVSLVSRDAERA